MTSIIFKQNNFNYVSFEGYPDIIAELRARYSFYTKQYKYDKRYQLGYWDGKISLINTKDSIFYAGLLEEIKTYLREENIDFRDETEIGNNEPVTMEWVENLYRELNGPFKPYKEQIDAVRDCITRARNIILAPTSLGKSYIIHALNAYYAKKNLKTLVIVNRAVLVKQLKFNFEDEYNSKPLYKTTTIYDYNDGDTDAEVVTSTWQSLVDKPASFFKKFDVIIGDEVHAFKAKSLISIIDKCGHIQYRHGLTATLDNDSQTDALTLEGMFGKPYRVTTLRAQIDAGISADPIIYVVKLNYSKRIKDDYKKFLKQMMDNEKAANPSISKSRLGALAFTAESKFLETLECRNEIIAKIASLQKGNTLIAFKNHEHGKEIERVVSSHVKKQPMFFVNSTVSKEKRFKIQQQIEDLRQSISVVSFGTFSTGINIKNLQNLIIASQVKSSITVPQLIGRMIRLFENKKPFIIDICDDLSGNSNGIKNIFYRHFQDRMKFYMQSKFKINVKEINVD